MAISSFNLSSLRPPSDSGMSARMAERSKSLDDARARFFSRIESRAGEKAGASTVTISEAGQAMAQKAATTASTDTSTAGVVGGGAAIAAYKSNALMGSTEAVGGAAVNSLSKSGGIDTSATDEQQRRIRDINFIQEVQQLNQLQTQMQVGTSTLGQANAAPQQILSLFS